jgi:transposase-like protein
MAKKRAGHVRLTCPHCHKSVNVQRPQGFQRTMPCPNCRIPISTDYIVSAESTESTETPES